MIVVSDTSPLNYLVLIDLQHILPQLFERILIPEAVREELQAAGAPEPIAQLLAAEPKWLETRRVSEIEPKLQHLALAISADLVLLDERKGRQAARERGLAVSGTLGVLDLAARWRLTNMPDALRRLQRTSFRASPRLIRHILATEKGFE